MLVTTPEETKRIVHSESEAVTRSWPGDCPYSPKDKVFLAADRGKGIAPVRYAGIEILSVRPVDLEDRTKGKEADGLAESEGFTSGGHWRAHWNRHFDDRTGDRFKLYRIRFRIVHVEKDVVEVISAFGPNKNQQQAR